MTLEQPLPGYVITTPFNGYPGHRGADFAAPDGTPILAAHEGIVRFSGWDDRGGYMIYLSAHDGGSETSYQHMNSRPIAAQGQHVKTGQVLGYVGTTGFSTGTHLHFEYWVNGLAWQGGTAVDPAPFIDTGKIVEPEVKKKVKKMIGLMIADGEGRYGAKGTKYFATYDGYAHISLTSDDANAISLFFGVSFANVSYRAWDAYITAAREVL